jgi:6-pyruvoyltetrahydropterin/6-carboxytetrahydropterin synthase
MFRIKKQFHFYAAHKITSLGPHAKCATLHGHTYEVILIVEGNDLKGPGFLREFCELDAFERHLKTHYDHKTLNDLEEFQGVEPTTEHLAYNLFATAKRMFPDTVEIRVSETKNTWVTYRE